MVKRKQTTSSSELKTVPIVISLQRYKDLPILQTTSKSYWGVEHLQPFFPPASSALSSLGSLLLDKNKDSIQSQSLNFRPPSRTTSKVVQDINISAGSLANSR